MKLKYMFVILPLIAFVGCEMPGNSQPSTPSSKKEVKTFYECEDGAYSFEFKQIDPNTVEIVDAAGNKGKLISIPSASGASYANSEYKLMTKGDDAILIYADKDNGKSYSKRGCKIRK